MVRIEVGPLKRLSAYLTFVGGVLEDFLLLRCCEIALRVTALTDSADGLVARLESLTLHPALQRHGLRLWMLPTT